MISRSSGQGIGARVARKEDAKHLAGRGQFVADMAMAGLREVAFVRSPLAHARIRGVTKPAPADGLVFVREDLAAVRSVRSDLRMPGFKSSEYPPLAEGKVRFVGEPIAMCVAASRAQAEDIAELVELDLEELPPLVDPSTVQNAEARVHDDWPDNLFLTTAIDTGLDEAVAGAAFVVRQECRLSRQVMNPMEGKAVLAHWDDRADQLVVYTSTQIPHLIRTALADHLGLREAQVRVVAPDVGGAFGYKCVLQPEELCLAWLALRFRRPFRYIEDRREHLISGANCREHRYSLTAYTDDRGRILGLDAQITVDAGAYSVWPFTSCLEGTMAGVHLPGPYALGSYRVKTFSVATNKPPIVPYRGVARTGICFAMELTIDAIARAVGREAWQVRRDNLVSAEAMPYRSPTGRVYDSGDYRRCMDLALERIDVGALRAEQAGRDGVLLGVGFANYIEMTAHGTMAFAAAGYPFIPGFEQATVRITPDGGVEIRAGVHSHGQGMETSLAQIAHEVLGVPIGEMAVLLGDTAQTPFSTGTYASRSITMAGGAVARACRVLAGRMARIAAHLLQCAAAEVELRQGRFYGPTGDASIRAVAEAWYKAPQSLPADVNSGGLEVTEGFKPKTDGGQFSNGTHAVVVEVDCELATVKVVKYVIVEDCGTRVNPLIVDGQTYGGAAQGIGTALFEEMSFDANGQPLASTLADYILPGASDVPEFELVHLESPSPYTEFGIKGAGEGGAIPPPAAIINAVNDALARRGIVLSETPLTARRLRAALAAADARNAQGHAA